MHLLRPLAPLLLVSVQKARIRDGTDSHGMDHGASGCFGTKQEGASFG